MSRIEELPDDFDESVNINDARKMDSIEELYLQHISNTAPEQNQMSSKSFEEIVQDMSKTPIFMNSLDQAANDGTAKTISIHANFWLSLWVS
jgi:hypothetical protein